jgi:hypothetical protein
MVSFKIWYLNKVIKNLNLIGLQQKSLIPTFYREKIQPQKRRLPKCLFLSIALQGLKVLMGCKI